MSTKLNVSGNRSPIGKKLWNMHQKEEATHVDHYKEGKCWACFSRKAVGATIIDVCLECAEKKAPEAILSVIKPNFYAYCMICGKYKFKTQQLNVRLCESDMQRVKERMHTLRKQGIYGTDPFFKSLRKKQGKDWAILFGNGARRIF